MPEDLTVHFKNLFDESRVTREGGIENYKRADFYIGKYGPYTELIPLDKFSDAELALRVNKIKATLANLPK